MVQIRFPASSIYLFVIMALTSRQMYWYFFHLCKTYIVKLFAIFVLFWNHLYTIFYRKKQYNLCFALENIIKGNINEIIDFSFFFCLQILKKLLQNIPNTVLPEELKRIADAAHGFVGADLLAVCKEGKELEIAKKIVIILKLIFSTVRIS